MSATDWYAPNQQAVRADGSGPAEEGKGAGKAKAKAKAETKTETKTETKAEAKDKAGG